MNPERQSFIPGARVTWMQESRGGYGYQIPVAAVVVWSGTERSRIKVWSLRKSDVVERTVSTANLRPNRTNLVEGLDN